MCPLNDLRKLQLASVVTEKNQRVGSTLVPSTRWAGILAPRVWFFFFFLSKRASGSIVISAPLPGQMASKSTPRALPRPSCSGMEVAAQGHLLVEAGAAETADRVRQGFFFLYCTALRTCTLACPVYSTAFCTLNSMTSRVSACCSTSRAICGRGRRSRDAALQLQQLPVAALYLAESRPRRPSRRPAGSRRTRPTCPVRTCPRSGRPPTSYSMISQLALDADLAVLALLHLAQLYSCMAAWKVRASAVAQDARMRHSRVRAMLDFRRRQRLHGAQLGGRLMLSPRALMSLPIELVGNPRCCWRRRMDVRKRVFCFPSRLTSAIRCWFSS